MDALKASAAAGIEVLGGVARALIKNVIVRGGQGDLLVENSGSFKVSNAWISKLCKAYNLVVRRVTTAKHNVPDDWEQQGETLATRLALICMYDKVPPELVVNLDQSGLHLLPTSSVTRALVGAEQVSGIAAGDKRQITATFVVSASGFMLHPQLIFKGLTDRSLPEVRACAASSTAHVL